MGSCFSSDSSSSGSSSGRSSRSTAKVVLHDGSLREYACAVTAYQVLSDHHRENSSSYFVCSSDELFYDTQVQALGPLQSVQLEQLYFVLPHSELGRRLSGSDMAALAVKASSALNAAEDFGKKKANRRSVIQVMPVSDDHACIYLEEGGGDAHALETINGLTMRLDSSAANSLRRNLASPKNIKRKRLCTIEELAE